jgi:hypothetical protein
MAWRSVSKRARISRLPNPGLNTFKAKGKQALREELAPLAAMRPVFDFRIKQIIQSGDIALMHTLWNVPSPEPMSVYAIEVARRQPDGAWCWLIGDPFTAGRQNAG